uniref:MRN complex-interacting protein isoform X1 n=1 Tax=Monopterus albus TaxID=43700 RepID=UPI0009B42D2E|nr:MRN complex-interacting protein isoform X1 [Monopterus albus]
MVQEFHILRCFKCQSFQVQQVKKMNRWICKLCGEKQSLVKEFGRGPGADCRRHVQKLNAMRGAKMEEQEANIWKRVGPDREEEAEAETGHQLGTPRQVKQAQVSRWSKYLDPPEEAEPWKEEKDVLMYRQKLHGNKITDRKRRGGWALEQAHCSSLKLCRLSATTSPPCLKTTSPNQSSLSSKKSINPPSVIQSSLPCRSTTPVSKWDPFLSSDCQGQEGEESVGGATYLPCYDVIGRASLPPPVSSMFESREDFSFDDEFLTD